MFHQEQMIEAKNGYGVAGLQRIDYQSSVDGTRDWALALPPEQGRNWIVCLHGHGSHGDQLYTREDVRNIWLPAFRSRGYGILTPNLRDNAWMSPAAVTDLDNLLHLLRRRFGAKRFVFASGSMGGSGNLIYAARRPQNVDAVIARGAANDLASYHDWCRRQSQPAVLNEIANAIENAYGGTPEELPEVYHRHSALLNAQSLEMPIFLSHGAADYVIPVSQSRRLIAALAEKSNLAYLEIPSGNHDSPLHFNPPIHPLDWLQTFSTNAQPQSGTNS